MTAARTLTDADLAAIAQIVENITRTRRKPRPGPEPVAVPIDRRREIEDLVSRKYGKLSRRAKP